MNSTNKDYDNLTLIAGIGDKRQQLLRQSLHVRTFLDLANLPAAKIEAAFKAEGQIISRDMIDQWIAQAKELAANAQPVSPQGVTSADIGTGREANSPAEGGEWEWLAAFLVEFRALTVEGHVKERQIRVEQRKIDKKGSWLEDDKKNNHPIFIEGERLYQWMVEQLGEKMWPTPEEERLTQSPPAEAPAAKPPSGEPSPVEGQPPASSPTEIPRIRVEVTQIRAFQPPDIDTPSAIGEANQPFLGRLKGGEPLALEVAFRLPEPEIVGLVTRETAYLANFYVCNWDTNVTTSVGDTEMDRLAPGKVSYTARLPQVTFQSGTYRLGVLVKLRTSPPSINYLESPQLVVV
jgi:hypothetical protein